MITTMHVVKVLSFGCQSKEREIRIRRVEQKIDCLISDPLLCPNAYIMLPPYTAVGKIAQSATMLLCHNAFYHFGAGCRKYAAYVLNYRCLKIVSA